MSEPGARPTPHDGYLLARILAGAPVPEPDAFSSDVARSVADSVRSGNGLPRGQVFDRHLDLLDPALAEQIRRLIVAADPVRPPQVANLGRTDWTADDLLGAQFPDPVWAVPGLLPVGLTILAGRPKLGKSFLALQIACAIGAGGQALGIPVSAGPVWYCGLEDGPRRLQSRLRAQHWPSGLPVRFATDLPRFSEGGLDVLRGVIEREMPRLVVIDTLARTMPRKSDQNDYGEMTDALSEIQKIGISAECSITCVEHHNKLNQGDQVTDLLGSTAKAGVADAILGLYRERGHQTATLKATGRDIEDRELELQWDRLTCTWVNLGDAQMVQTTKAQEAVLTALGELGGVATTSHLGSTTGMDKGYISRTLADLVATGRVERLRPIGREVPYRLIPRGSNVGPPEQLEM